MEWYHTLIFAVAIGGASINLKSWRTVFAISLIIGSYGASVLYVNNSLPYPIVFAGACDAAFAFVLYLVAKFKWEILVFNVLRLMILVNILYGLNVHFLEPSAMIYYASLELITLLALIFIGGRRYLGSVQGHVHSNAGWLVRHFCSLRSSLEAKRESAPWTSV
jgi:hypothetical protein